MNEEKLKQHIEALQDMARFHINKSINIYYTIDSEFTPYDHTNNKYLNELNDIYSKICEIYNTTPSIVNASRKQENAKIKSFFASIFYEMYFGKISLKLVGELLNYKCHSTLCNNKDNVIAEMKYNKILKNEYDAIKCIIVDYLNTKN